MDIARPVEAVIPGARGRLLGVLARTTEPLNLRTVARLAGVSPAQAVRVLPGLVALGIVERREVPPSSLLLLARGNLAGRLIVELSGLGSALLDALARAGRELDPPPESLVIFGSFARGDAVAGSDLDVLFVRPATVPEDDDRWAASVARWVSRAERLSGNPVNRIEVSAPEAASFLRSRRPVWRAVVREGIVLAGRSPSDLGRTHSA
ncbi:MAG: helix-turn-helix domain-containing protein [Acidobacteria bacterium]|nr:helix-turn-helix domain-containing protein [Acidobacteriota bacterium]